MSSQAPIQSLQAAWKKIAPLELADNSWDNVGVMIGESQPKDDLKICFELNPHPIRL